MNVVLIILTGIPFEIGGLAVIPSIRALPKLDNICSRHRRN